MKLLRIVNAECDISAFQIGRQCIEGTDLIGTACTVRILHRCHRNEFQIPAFRHDQLTEPHEIDQLAEWPRINECFCEIDLFYALTW